MSIQSLPGPKTIGVCAFTLNKMVSDNCELQKEKKEALIALEVEKQANKILKAENTVLKNDNTKLKDAKTEKETLDLLCS